MTKSIYFAGGCFWGTEHYFKQVRGVVATEVGYANGRVPEEALKAVPAGQIIVQAPENAVVAQASQNAIAAQVAPQPTQWAPTYEEVYTDTTGFVETVRIEYDPERVSLQLLGELFFRSIDPTSLNRQGEDIGTRYRTGVYFTSDEDRVLFEALFEKVKATLDLPLVVELEPLRNFYPAEDYHQDYLDKHPEGYCHLPWSLMQFAKEANAEASR
jgi:peptide methionine sulfoxide reductase msrA/msrB